MSQGSRAKNRENKVRALPDTPDGKRLVEILVVLGEPDARGGVKQSGKPYRRVHQEAGPVVADLANLALEEAVGDGHRVEQVAEEVVNSGPHRLRQRAGVTPGYGPHEVSVTEVVEPVDRAVQGLQRVSFFSRGRCVPAGTPGAGQGNDPGQQDRQRELAAAAATSGQAADHRFSADACGRRRDCSRSSHSWISASRDVNRAF